MKDIGLMINKMVKGRKLLIMDQFTLEIMLMEKSMEKDIINGLIILSISVGGYKIHFPVMAYINRPMEVDMRDNG